MSTIRQRAASWQYRAATSLLEPVAPLLLRRRLSRGKEDPNRWREKLGTPSIARPKGPLVWLHAVGLGEVLSTRPVIQALRNRLPELNFLVTSGTRASADVFAVHAPADTLHQFLPLDMPNAIDRFLDHWTPDLSIWLEQDIWPGFVAEIADRDIPLALINARMHKASFRKRSRAAGLSQATYQRFDLICAQDQMSADHLRRFCGNDVQVKPNLKSLGPPLDTDAKLLADWEEVLEGYKVWTVGSAHMADIAPALKAHRILLIEDPTHTLVIMPRYPAEVAAIQTHLNDAGFSHSLATKPEPTQVIIEPRFGYAGLWYSMADRALIGGGFDKTGGHNPWEALHLGCAVFYGPNTANFADDYKMLDTARAAIPVSSGVELAEGLRSIHPAAQAKNIAWAIKGQHQTLRPLFNRLAAMVRAPR